MIGRRVLDRIRQRTSVGEAEIGEGTVCPRECLDGIAPDLITIGCGCIVAPSAMILTHDASLLVHTGKYLVRPVTIGDNVFVGYGAIVMPGVTIGDGAVIGAGAVVTRDVPAGVVAVGVPAEVVGSVEEMVARQDPRDLVDPPYPTTYDPSPSQVRELRRSILERRHRRLPRSGS